MFNYWGITRLFPKWQHPNPNAVNEDADFSMFLPILVIILFIIANLVSVKWYLTVVLICIPLMTNAEKAMATHSSTLAWKFPWTEEPGGLQSMGSRRAGHNWATSLSLFTLMHWRIPGMVEPGGLPSMGSHRVGHNWSDLAAAAAWLMTVSTFSGAF